MKLFGGSASTQLATRIASQMQLSLCETDVHIFPDGERRIKVGEGVVGEETVVVQSANTPVDTNYMELFFLIDALKRSGAGSVSAVVPYFGYQRQDHVFRDGEAVSLEVVVSILENLKIKKLISFDMHTSKTPSLFHIPVAHLSALPLFAQEITQQQWNTPDTILISPDTGGVGRIKKLSALLNNMDFAVLEKDRDLSTGVISISGLEEGSVVGKKRAILVDDLISSGNTLIQAATVLQKLGIEEVIVFATHPVFSEDAPERLQASLIKNVFVTDTVLVPPEKNFQKLTILSVADIVAGELASPTESNSTLVGETIA